MLPELFSSLTRFHDAFAAGLTRLLSDDALGSYILVEANAAIDDTLASGLEGPLQQRFQHLSEQIHEQLQTGRCFGGNPEDLTVCLKLMAIGRQHLAPPQSRPLQPWELRFNPLRAFRPQRMTSQRVTGLSHTFDPQGFHFNLDFLRKEDIWSGELLDRHCHLLYNKFPFVPYHGLLVPDAAAGRPQFLQPNDLDYFWQVTQLLGAQLPGFGLAYNAYGAFASVNHLHAHTFMREAPLPVESPQWQHNGGTDAYPLPCRTFGSADEARPFIQQLHDQQITYNLMMRPGCIYLLPRRHQGDYPQATWTSGFAWYEVCGGVVTFNRDDFEQLAPDMMRVELSQLRPESPT